MDKHILWVVGLIIIISIICGTLIYLNSHPYVFEIGNNAKEAFKSINWSAIPK